MKFKYKLAIFFFLMSYAHGWYAHLSTASDAVWPGIVSFIALIAGAALVIIEYVDPMGDGG